MPLPEEWKSVSDELEEAWDCIQPTPGFTAVLEGGFVHISIVIPREEASDLLDQSARYDDHECEAGWEAICDFHGAICGALIDVASTLDDPGDLAGDRCEDDED